MCAAEQIQIAMRAVRMYAESHPRPCHVTQVQAAEMLDVSRSTISRLIKSGNLKLNRVGMIPVVQIDEILLAD